MSRNNISIAIVTIFMANNARLPSTYIAVLYLPRYIVRQLDKQRCYDMTVAYFFADLMPHLIMVLQGFM